MFRLSINNINNVSVYFCDSFSLCHNRLGHLNFIRMNDMVKLHLIPYVNKNDDKCKICMTTKITRQPFPSVQWSSNIFDSIHSGIGEMNGQLTTGDKRYFITFIDNCSRFCYVYLLSSKHGALVMFETHKHEVELHCENFMKCLRSDKGDEYYDPSYFKATNIVHQVTAPYTWQQNSVIERKNRVLIEMVNAMPSNSSLEPGF